MKSKLLFLALLLGLLSGHADSGEKDAAVSAVTVTPDISPIPLLPIWKSIVDANACGYCNTDTDDPASLTYVGIEEDLIYHVVHALQQDKNVFHKDGYLPGSPGDDFKVRRKP